MKFSDNANQYLGKIHRDSNFVIADRQIVADYLKRQNIQPLEKIIEFQSDFSGLELTIANKPELMFKAYLFSSSDISSNKPIETIDINSEVYFYCGDHQTAQFYFVISSCGQIGTYDNSTETVNIFSSSFEKFIETYAFKDLLQQNKKYEHPYHYDVIDNNQFESHTQDFLHYNSASDDYNSWLSDSKLIIHKGTWYDKPGFYIHLYGDDTAHCEAFVQRLKDKQIVRR